MELKTLITEKILPIRLPQVTLGVFWITAFSGMILLFGYTPFGNVFKNVQDLTALYPYGEFFRRLHYFGAQMFLILTLIHVGDHFYKKSYKKSKKTRWIYLTASTATVFFCS